MNRLISNILLLALAGLLVLVTPSAKSDPIPAPPLRSRWTIYSGIGTPVYRYANGTRLGPWEQPTLLELTGVSYTLIRPWLEVRAAALFGQRLDRPGNSAGALLSISLAVAPLNLGLAAIVLNTPTAGTNPGIALTFGLGQRVRNGWSISLGGQIATYPGLGWPVTIVFAPSVAYRFP
ncbi:hypothetical protein KBD34_01720 [Patescibacteria group bacterium]|nr:hypothetical protein [Patescibacteria group bacterium]